MDDLAWGTDAELSDEQFYNRKQEILWIKNLLESTAQGSAPTLMVSGIRGVGKTVLLKKIKKELQDDYLICYLDLSATSGYQMGKLTETGIMQHLYQSWMAECEARKFSTILKKVSKYFKTKRFGLAEVIDAGGIPLPVPKSEDDYQKLSSFVLDLPQQIYQEHQDQIQGTILILDEFQALKDLEDHLDTFLWYLRSVIQTQKRVAYIFSGSVSSTDTLLSRVAGSDGAFGGRMLNVEVHPFSPETVRNYLKEKLPSLQLNDQGLERFYQCTRGIPFYVNTFAKLLQKNTPLGEEEVRSEFQRTLPYLALHLINQWSRLTLQEQKIVTQLLDAPIRRKEIAEKLEVTSGSLSGALNKLLDQELIAHQEGSYGISEPILGAWLKKEHQEKGVYPFRGI